MTPERKQKLMNRTVKIILNGGSILIRRKYPTLSIYKYLHHWTNIAAGPDSANWTPLRSKALEMFSLEWAFAIAKLYNAKVVVVYPKGAKHGGKGKDR